jgi:hypothetical protein
MPIAEKRRCNFIFMPQDYTSPAQKESVETTK